jgi:THO complex subunit 1
MSIGNNLEFCELFAQAIRQCKGEVEPLQVVFNETPGVEVDKKSILEQAFRDVVHDKIKSMKPSQLDGLTKLVLLANASAELGISLYTVPFILLGDIFDCLTLDICEEIFSFVEAHVSTWVRPEFYSAGKILLLRMCNDLLRRLSSAQNTVFCGRIQLFLAQLFPLSEKSALNLMSHFNLENITAFNEDELRGTKTSATCTPMEVESTSFSFDTADTNAPIDFNLYRRLWSLQDFFRQPTQCYSSEQWKILTVNMEDVFKAFESYKLEEEARSSGSRKRQRTSSLSANVEDYRESHYFAKFLTSEKLMNLQLHDSHFRRHVLVQCLILFQYLTSEVKFKATSLVLVDAQAQWIKDATERVYALIKETPPNGEEFAAYISQVLMREKSWIAWKNDGCPSYEKEPQSDSKPYPQRQHLGDSLSSKIDIGNPELSRLWNLCPDNLLACKQTGRIFMPDKLRFLEEPIEQADPEAKIEAEYKMVNNTNFSWQGLRLLSATSSHFFQNTTANIKPIPEYLEHVILQEAKDMQQQQQQQQANSETVNGTAGN